MDSALKCLISSEAQDPYTKKKQEKILQKIV